MQKSYALLSITLTLVIAMGYFTYTLYFQNKVSNLIYAKWEEK